MAEAVRPQKRKKAKKKTEKHEDSYIKEDKARSKWFLEDKAVIAGAGKMISMGLVRSVVEVLRSDAILILGLKFGPMRL